MKKITLLAILSLSAGLIAACGGDGGGGEGDLSGTIRIDGSSTVAPLSEPAAELYGEEQPDVRVTVGTSGTGGGFEKFCRGETDLSDASRPIKEEEIEICERNGIDYEELTVANDGIAIAINQDNDWAECLTVDQLRTIWGPDSDAETWSDVDPSFPDERLDLYGPGTDSGTFDFFTEAINGEEGAQRTDYNNVGEDDNATVRGVEGTKGGIGYLGLSFVKENEERIKAAQVDGGDGCVAPSDETVQDGTYKPLGRELFVYASDKAVRRPEVKAFLEFYIQNSQQIAEQALFVPMTEEQQEESLSEVERLAGGQAGE